MNPGVIAVLAITIHFMLRMWTKKCICLSRTHFPHVDETMNREAAVGASRVTRRVADLARSLVPCQQHVRTLTEYAALMVVGGSVRQVH